MSRFDMMGGRTASGEPGKLRGAYLAIVTNNKSDGGPKHRVKLVFPWLSGKQEESHWARVAVPMAGKDRGAYFLPDVDDQVLVVFEHGDIRRPIVIGSLWSRAQPPPERNKNGKNNARVIKSRSGHRLIFDDTNDAERVVLVDSTGKNKIVLDGSKGDVTVETQSGDIEIRASAGAARLHADNIRVGASSSLSAEGTAKLQMATRGELSAAASSSLDLKGPMVQLNPDGFGGGGGGSASGGSSAPGAGSAAQPRDQVREEDGAASPGASTGGSPGARARASEQHLPPTDEPGEPPAPPPGEAPGRRPTAADRSRAAERGLGTGAGSGSDGRGGS